MIVSVGEAKLVQPAIAFDSLFEPNTARVLEDMKTRYREYVEKATEKLVSSYEQVKEEATEVIRFASYHVIVGITRRAER